MLWKNLPDEIKNILEHTESFDGHARTVLVLRSLPSYQMALDYVKGEEGSSFLFLKEETEEGAFIRLHSHIEEENLRHEKERNDKIKKEQDQRRQEMKNK